MDIPFLRDQAYRTASQPDVCRQTACDLLTVSLAANSVPSQPERQKLSPGAECG